MKKNNWHIYLKEIPFTRENNLWVSFESDPRLTKTNKDIYGRCLPCIQNLYQQLKDDRSEITLGNAYNCWKVTVILTDFEECLAFLHEFEKKYPLGHVFGKVGSGRSNSATQVVVFHTESIEERDRLQLASKECLPAVNENAPIQISRACSVLYDDILGDWRKWRPTTPIMRPDQKANLLERIKKILYFSVM